MTNAERALPAGNFPIRTENDMLIGLHYANPDQIVPRPEAMSEAPNVDVLAYTPYPGVDAGTHVYGRDTNQDVVTRYTDSTLVLQPGLSALRPRSMQYGPRGIADPLIRQREQAEDGRAYLFHGSFHNTPDNSDVPEERTILSFPAASGRLGDDRPGTGCTLIVKGRHDFDTTLAKAREALPVLMNELEREKTPEEKNSPYAAEPIKIHPADGDYEVELGTVKNNARPFREREVPVSEMSVRSNLGILVADMRNAMHIARVNDPNADPEALVDRVLAANHWRLQIDLHENKLSADSAVSLREQLKEAMLIPANHIRDWNLEHGVGLGFINQMDQEERPGQGVETFLDEPVPPKTNVAQKIGSVLSFGLSRRRAKAPRRQTHEHGSIFDAAPGAEWPDESPFVDNTEAAPAKTREKGSFPGRNVWNRVRRAASTRATEFYIGRESGDNDRRGLRRALGIATVGLVGASGAYLAWRAGFSFSGMGRQVVEGQAHPAPKLPAEAIPTPSHPAIPSPHVLPPDPDHHLHIPGFELVPPATGASAQPVTETFHLAAGETLWQYAQHSLPSGASNKDVYKEVVRIMEVNHMPVHASGFDPLEAARHIRPEDVLQLR
ncbi:MAG TPA: hypothetical protein VJR27_04540 [Candidatus Saccharimonadales bacterium]|nr:hypothetical protein [Candidatus Saccharimonadales bacterium]